MTRWLPGGLASRVTALLAASLIVAQLVSIPMYLKEQAAAATQLFEQSTLQRIGEISAYFDTLNSQQRRELLPLLSSPSLDIEVFFELQNSDKLGLDEDDLRIEQALVKNLGVKARVGHADSIPVTRPLSDLFPSQQKVVIWVPLRDGHWLRFVTASYLPSLNWILHMGAQVSLLFVVVILFAIWAGQQLTRPMRSFAAAAERLGTDVNAPPLPEQGSRELRMATRAFNQMQQRVQSYLADRTQMLAAISHDLRTALTRLRLRIEFIDDEAQKLKAEHDLEAMQNMLSSTLSFARDDAASEALARLDLAQMLHSACDDQADLGVNIEYHGPANLSFDCRPVALQRAVNNLLSNAARFASNVSVSLYTLPGELQIVVEDDGPGIPENERERVFEPFVRLDTARSPHGAGSGLGLAIVRSVAHSHGGTVKLETATMGGLMVSLMLPYKESGSGVERLEPTPTSQAKRRSKKKSVAT